MNTQTNDSGPAFPMPAHNSAIGEQTHPIYGMTLRDYMIIHAPALEVDCCIPNGVGEIAKWLGVENYIWKEHYPIALAKARGIWADAMLAARERKGDA